MYKLVNHSMGDQVIIRSADNACIPIDPRNKDYVEYQAWLKAGNTPAPPDLLPDPEPTRDERLTTSLDAAKVNLSARLDTASADLAKKLDPAIAEVIRAMVETAVAGVVDTIMGALSPATAEASVVRKR